MKYFFGAMGILTLMAIFGHHYVESLFTTNKLRSFSEWGAVYSLPMAYAGLLFSAYAAFAVHSLTKRYVARARLPVIGKDLERDIATLLDFATNPVRDLVASPLLPRIIGSLNAVKKHGKQPFRGNLKKSMRSLSDLRSSSKRLDNNLKNSGEIESYWDTYHEINLLIVDIKNYVEDEKRRQDVH